MSHSDKAKKKRQKALKKLNKETGGGKSFDEARAKKKKERSKKREDIAATQKPLIARRRAGEDVDINAATSTRERTQSSTEIAAGQAPTAGATDAIEVDEQTPEEKNAIIEAQIADQQRRNQADQDRDRARATAQGLTIEELEAQATASGVAGFGRADPDPSVFGIEGPIPGPTGTTQIGAGAVSPEDRPPFVPKTPVGTDLQEFFGDDFALLERATDPNFLNVILGHSATKRDGTTDPKGFANDVLKNASVMREIEESFIDGKITQAEFVSIVNTLNGAATEAQFQVTTTGGAAALGFSSDPSAGLEERAPGQSTVLARPTPVTSETQEAAKEAGFPDIEVEPADTQIEPRASTFELTQQMRDLISDPSAIGAKVSELSAALAGGNPKMVTEALREFNFPLPLGVTWDGDKFDVGVLAGTEVAGLPAYLAALTPMFQLRDIVRDLQGVTLTAEQQLSKDEFDRATALLVQGMASQTQITIANQSLLVQIEQNKARLEDADLDREQRTTLERQNRELQDALNIRTNQLERDLQKNQQRFSETFEQLKADIRLERLVQERDLFKIDAPTSAREIQEQVAGLTGQGASLLAADYTTEKFAQVQEWAAQVGSLELPAGVIWDENTGDFVLRAGFDGRQITPEAAKYMASIRGLFQMRANAVAAATREEEIRADIRASEDERVRQERDFNDAMAKGEVRSAAQALALQRVAEAKKLDQERKLLPMDLALKLFQNPVMMGLAQFYGFTATLEQELGFKFPANSFGTAGAKSAKEIGIADFLKADEATRGVMQAAFSAETGGGQAEFMRGLAGQLPAQARRQTNVGSV